MEYSREQLKDIFRFVPGTAVLYLAENGKIRPLYYTEDVPAFSGLTEEEYLSLYGADAEQAVLDADRPALREKLKRMLAGEAFSDTFRTHHKTRLYVWTHADVKPVGTCGGCPVFLSTFLDVSGSFATNTPGGIFVYSAAEDGQFFYVSQPMLDMLGYTREEFAAKFDNCFSQMVYREDRERVLKEISCQIRGNGDYDTCEYRIEKKDGSLIWVHDEGHFVIDENGKQWFYVIDTDITNSVEERSILIRKSDVLESMVNNIPAGVIVYRVKNGKVSYVTSNGRILDILGLDADYLRSGDQTLFAEYIHPDDRAEAVRVIHRITVPGAEAQFCFRYTPPGRTCRWLRAEMRSAVQPDGAVQAFSVISDITKEKTSELELDEAERRYYQEIIQSMLTAAEHSLCTVQLDLTDNLCREGRGTSEYLVNALRSSTADGFFARCASFIPDEKIREHFFRSCSREAYLAMFENGKHRAAAEFSVPVENGRMIWVRSLMSMVRNPKNGHVEAVAFSQDITAAKRREEIFDIITKQEYDYVALLYVEMNKIEFLNLSSKLLPKYHEAFGQPGRLYDFDAVRHYAADSWIDSADREEYLKTSTAAAVKRQLDELGNCEFSVRGHYSGHPESVMCRKIQHYYLGSEKDTILIIESDATATYLQRQKEMELAKSENERLSDIFNRVSSGICVLRMPDPCHVQTSFCNQQIYRMLELPPVGSTMEEIEKSGEPLVTRYFSDEFSGIHPDDRDRTRELFRRGFSQERFTVPKIRYLTGKGEYKCLTVDLVLRESGPDGKVFYASYRDVSRETALQKELEEQRLRQEEKLRGALAQAQKASEAKSDFLSRMSHDIRTPLNGIIGMTYLTEKLDLPAEAHENLKKIDTSSKFLLSLINDVLDMSKAESGKIELHPEPYSFRDFFSYLDAVIRPLCEGKNQELVIDAVPAEGVVPLMDELRMNQIYFNLFSNAVKYTPEKGTITCRMRAALTGPRRLALQVSVSDTGIGMSEEFQKHLFEPFLQENRSDISEQRGSGLGLSIVKKLVDLMGGTIRVESKLGKGSVFQLGFEFDCLPADALPQRQDEGNGVAGDFPDLRGKHVLLCEDHPLNQEIARALLEEKGMKVETAEDGKQGVAKFLQSPPCFYDAILMDIRMPVLDGYGASKQIRALKRRDAKTVPIIAMTADAFADDVQKCRDAGMNGHIAKPIDPQQIFSGLSELIRKTPGSR